MTRILIDGYNLLTSSDYPNREVFLEAVSRYAKAKRFHITVLFDGTHDGTGQGERSRSGGIDVWYSPLTVTADEEIEELLEHPEAGGWIVVSNDRRIQKAALRAQAAYVKCEEFLPRLAHMASVESPTEKPPWLEGREEEARPSPRPSKQKGRKLSKTERKRKRRMNKL